ncbi:hypothetical protein GN958_ATG21754, partial [Phytophthora infestans]
RMTDTESRPSHVKLRYRALAYVRRIGRQRRPVRAATPRSFAGTGEERSIKNLSGRRSIAQISSKRGFADTGGLLSGSRKSSTESGSKSQLNCLNSNGRDSTWRENKVNTRSRRGSSKARRGPNTPQANAGKRRHQFLMSHQNHDGLRFGLFCGCSIEHDAIDPNATTRNEKHYIDTRSGGAQATGFDSGFGFTCTSPVACPPPLGLELTRTASTTLQLRSRDGRRSLKLALSGNSAMGLKRKAPSVSSGYPSYTPSTPPSAFVSDFTSPSTLKNTRNRSRVSVGCNGWFMNDDDPAIVGWYRHRSSDEGNPITQRAGLAQASRDSDAEFARDLPKRYKTNTYANTDLEYATLIKLASNAKLDSACRPRYRTHTFTWHLLGDMYGHQQCQKSFNGRALTVTSAEHARYYASQRAVATKH